MNISIKISLLFFLLILLQSNKSYSANDSLETYSNSIKTNVFSPFVAQYQLAYEKNIYQNFSFQMTGGLISNTLFKTQAIRNVKSGYLLIPELRYRFLTLKDLMFYTGVFYRYHFFNNTYETTDVTGLKAFSKWTTSSKGLVLGIILLSEATKTKKQKEVVFIVDLFGGLQHIKVRNNNNFYKVDGGWTVKYEWDEALMITKPNSLQPRIGINLGFGF